MPLNIDVYKPRQAEAKKLVTCYWHIRSSNFEKPLVNIPDGHDEIIVDLLQNTAEIHCGRTHPLFMTVDKQVNVLIVRFPSLTLSSVKQLHTKQLRQTFRHVFKPAPIKEKIELVEMKMMELFQPPVAKNEVVREMIDWIQSTDSTQKLDDLYHRFDLGKRQLQACFKKHTGMTVKNFSRIVRLNRLRKFKSSISRPSLTQLAYEHGYYDQSHMIKDFRQITGLTPTVYFKRKSEVHFKFEG